MSTFDIEEISNNESLIELTETIGALVANGFTVHEALRTIKLSQSMVKKKKIEANIVESINKFIDEEIEPLTVFGNDDMTKAIELYKWYTRWCDNNDCIPTGRNTFYLSMQKIFKGKWKIIHKQLHFAVKYTAGGK